MSTTKIPARTIVTCDKCGAECVPGKNFLHGGRLTLARAALDFQGMPVADATVVMDLCDRCNDKMLDAINTAKEQKP